MTVRHPKPVEGVGYIYFGYPALGLSVMAERVKDDGYCELTFRQRNGTDENLIGTKKEILTGTPDEKIIHMTGIKLLSTSAMDNLAKTLKQKSNETPWPEILTFITGETIRIARKGEPVIEVTPSEDTTLEVEYLLEPLLYLNHPNIIFGDYSSLKSVTALSIGYIVQLPFHDNELGLTTKTESTKVLYLDWEDDQTTFAKRLGGLERGFGNGTMPILYLHMTDTLSNSVERLRRIVSDRNIGLLISDSLAPASRGNLNDTEPAIKYHAALRDIGITSLTLAHTAKDQLTRQRSVFGSVYFSNLTRSIWECKAEQEVGEPEATISLKNIKGNYSQLHHALGYHFTFNNSNNTISIAKADLRNTSLSGTLSLSLQIKNLLRSGAKPIKDIAEALDANEASVRTAISGANRMAQKGELTKVGDSWGLTQAVQQGAMPINQGAI